MKLVRCAGLKGGLPVWKVHPDIHPEDMALALAARIAQRRRERKKRMSVEESIEDFFITALANTPVEEWTKDMWTGIKQCVLRDKQFLVRLGRGIENPNRQLLDEIDFFLLANMRRGLNLRGKSPREVVALIRSNGKIAISKDNTTAARWWVSRRKRLGQPGRIEAENS